MATMPEADLPDRLPVLDRPNLIAGLMVKRAQIAGLVDALQDQLRAAMIDLDHVDCTVLLFDPDADLSEIKPKPLPPRHHAFKGQVTRAILVMLRESPEPLDVTEITRRLMEERELNLSDKRLTKTMRKRIGAALRASRERGLLASEAGGKGMLLWRVNAAGASLV